MRTSSSATHLAGAKAWADRPTRRQTKERPPMWGLYFVCGVSHRFERYTAFHGMKPDLVELPSQPLLRVKGDSSASFVVPVSTLS